MLSQIGKTVIKGQHGLGRTDLRRFKRWNNCCAADQHLSGLSPKRLLQAQLFWLDLPGNPCDELLG